jgi:hypothetical protein
MRLIIAALVCVLGTMLAPLVIKEANIKIN